MEKTILNGVVINNDRVGFLVIRIGENYERVYRNEISPMQPDHIGASIPVILTCRTDRFGKRILSNKEAMAVMGTVSKSVSSSDLATL